MSDDQLKVRKSMRHTPPAMIRVTDAWYFITICAADHHPWTMHTNGSAGTPCTPPSFEQIADVLLQHAREYHEIGKWKISIFTVMPDHLHFIVHVPSVGGVHGVPALPRLISDWKRWLVVKFGIAFQPDFFDTRIRDKSHYAEKWRYICNNPVTRGLCDSPRDWPYVIAFDRETGEELPHR